MALTIAAFLSLSMAACATWPFSSGPKDIRVLSVTDVDFKDQPQLEWFKYKMPRPSIIISRIDFTTNTDLLALAKRKEYNVAFVVGPCSKNRVKEGVDPYGGVFWGNVQIYSGTRDISGYAEAAAKGPPFTYQVYVKKLTPNVAKSPMCFTLDGGNMLGGTLRSNVAVIPNQ